MRCFFIFYNFPYPMKTSPIPWLLLLALAACKKDEVDALPDATREGKNTGGCLIDGKAFVAKGWGGGLLSNGVPPLSGGFAFDSVFYVELHGQHNGENTTVMLYLQNDKAGTYQLNRDTQYYPQGSPKYLLNHATYSTRNSSGEVYVTNSKYTGQVELTNADLRTGISSGTFEFTAVSTFDPSKTITITSGRFDRKQ
jgi:Family of unknown function (DUF6252)